MLRERDQVTHVIANSTLIASTIQQTLALGLLVMSKHDRAASTHGANYTTQDAEASNAFTPAEIARLREQAGIMLNQFSANLVLHKADRHTASDWWLTVWQGVVASWAYALSLIALAGLFRAFGSDIITAIEWWTGKPHP